MVLNGPPFKRPKRRFSAGLHDFLRFPGTDVTGSGGIQGPFRSAMKVFLQTHGRLLPLPSIFSPAAAASPPHLLTWRLVFRIGDSCRDAADTGAEDAVVELSVIEEDVLRARSIYCDHCRVVGWSGHPVCSKRYHFIIRNESSLSSDPRRTCCVRCGTPMPLSESNCPLCQNERASDEEGLVEDWELQLDNPAHLLHAVVHSNGFGHLLRVNGREGGSSFLTGREIMNFWDSLCQILHVRKVTVMDISKKYGMEYRLLHAVASGHPWYGEWGYKFGAGSFALTEDSYNDAVNIVSSIPLAQFFTHTRGAKLRTRVQDVIAFYQSLSDWKLVNLRDLFSYITNMLHKAHRPPAACNSALQTVHEDKSYSLCAWGNEDVELVESMMVKVLRAVGPLRWVPWRALRGSISKAIVSQELLDYVLKGLVGKVTDDGLVVSARCNAETSSVEYTLESSNGQQPGTFGALRPTVQHLSKDLKLLYDHLLNPFTMVSYKPLAVSESSRQAASKIIDCKQFIKNYDDSRASNIRQLIKNTALWCSIELADHPKEYVAAPQELLLMPVESTIADLKLQAAQAFQETYLFFQNIVIDHLPDLPTASDAVLLRCIFQSGDSLRLRGRCLGDYWRLGQFRMERGLENWTVDCFCGAKDDDGERMMACDSCGVWQHTRCSGIDDVEEVPAKFICGKCKKAPHKPKLRGGGGGEKKIEVLGGRCKIEMETSLGGVGSIGGLTTVGYM